MNETVNGIVLNYVEAGQGSPLILLHGNGEDHRIFDKLTNLLKQHFCVYAIDSRNHGESSSTEDFSYQSMANDICLFIKAKKLDDVSIIGFSDGGIIALLMAIGQKDIFKKMVLLGVNLKPTDFKDYIFDSLKEEYEKTKDPLLKMMIEEPNININDLSEIEIPTLVIAAEDDIFKEECFKTITEAMPNAILKIIEGHDHGSYVVDNDLLYPYLTEFL